MSKYIFSNIFKLYLTIMLSVLVFISCNNTNNNNKVEFKDVAKVEPKTLNIVGAWYGLGESELMMRDLVKQFELEHQEYKVNLFFREEMYGMDKDKMNSMYLTDIANSFKNNTYKWDVIFNNYDFNDKIERRLREENTYMPSFWCKEYLIDFNQNTEIKNAHKDFVFNLPYVESTFNGMLPGPIIEGGFGALWYNEELAKKIGLSIKTQGMGIDEFIAYVKKANNYNNTNSDKITILSESQRFLLFFALAYSDLFSNNLTKGNQKEMAMKAFHNAYIAIEELSKYNLFQIYDSENKAEIKNTEDYRNKLVANGKVLFSFGMSDVYNKWQAINKNKTAFLVPCEIPTFKGKSSVYYHGFFQPLFAIPKYAPNKEGAIEFLKFISTHNIAEKYEMVTKNPTGLKTVLSTNDFAQNKIEMHNNYIMKKYGNRILDLWGTYPLLLFNNFGHYHYLHFDSVFDGILTADEAIKKTVYEN